MPETHKNTAPHPSITPAAKQQGLTLPSPTLSAQGALWRPVLFKAVLVLMLACSLKNSMVMMLIMMLVMCLGTHLPLKTPFESNYEPSRMEIENTNERPLPVGHTLNSLTPTGQILYSTLGGQNKPYVSSALNH